MPILLDHQNREVRLTEERLTHILSHPEMVEMEAQIADTLKHPQLVRQSRSDESVALCYRFYTQLAIGDKWLCVVVKYLPDDAFIVTAYFTDKPKKGETLWQSAPNS
ncbi:DUF4258 domain-containing protein [Leptolyngbya sp. 7M]|uniref:DUF4258 domain-containing protein n=1 Tax=Leptolyngbya sp. 7M TaxID=2812896 RepID=UPI001B8BBC29|nr:DUF4258 domain-containing protein [Leptolyngbya sp. 7M]QYO63349.1 DUF4258 domain-containing protein [Leptolyngbya sp. 7M]